MNNTTSVVMAVIATICVVAVCLVWRSCGTEATVTCPSGASAHIQSRGSFESGAVEEICSDLEGTGQTSE